MVTLKTFILYGGSMTRIRIKQILSAAALISLLIAGGFGILPERLCAEEVQGYGPCYTPEELAKVREWEKTWVGKKIDKTNVDQVAEFMLPSYANEVYKNNEAWNEKESYYFFIAPYQRYTDTPGMQAATKKYAASVKTNAEGVITNYADIAGRPFPAPKTAMEHMYNFDFNTRGDANEHYRIGPVVEKKSRRERCSEQIMIEYYWAHRVDIDPLPALPDNPKAILKTTFLHLFTPPDMLDTMMINTRYMDINKSDDGYLWYSQFRRIRRMQTTQRQDTIAGTDLVYDDEYCWDNHIHLNTYKLVGTKDMLCARHMDITKNYQRVEGQTVPNGVTRERTKVLVIEAYNKNPDYVYKKRVLYLDPETYVSYWSEMYDNRERFWKGYEFWTNPVKLENNPQVEKMYICGGIFIDFDRMHGGSSRDTKPKVGMKEVDRQMFTISYMQQRGKSSH
jgi:hypothetical protein